MLLPHTPGTSPSPWERNHLLTFILLWPPGTGGSWRQAGLSGIVKATPQSGWGGGTQQHSGKSSVCWSWHWQLSAAGLPRASHPEMGALLSVTQPLLIWVLLQVLQCQ